MSFFMFDLVTKSVNWSARIRTHSAADTFYQQQQQWQNILIVSMGN